MGIMSIAKVAIDPLFLLVTSGLLWILVIMAIVTSPPSFASNLFVAGILFSAGSLTIHLFYLAGIIGIGLFDPAL